jgi:hypothetical protein
MNKFNYLIAGISVLLLINFQSVGVYAQQTKQDEPRVKSIDLSQKPYYERIFTKDERKQLKKANSALEDAKKYMIEYKLNQKEIENLYTIAKATNNPKTNTKSLNQARKMEQKSAKIGNKSIEYFKKGTGLKSNIYTTALNRTKLNDNSSYAQAGNELESLAKINFDKAREKAKNTPSYDEQIKLKSLFEANDLTLEGLAFQENAFAMYQKDPSVNPDKVYFYPETNISYKVDIPESGNTVVLDSILFPVYEDIYDPKKDTNLYHSRSIEIYKKLKLNKDEQKLLEDASRKNQYANGILKQVDDAYVIIDSLNYSADRTIDFAKRDELRNTAIEKEQQAFYKLMSATDIYINVNTTRYKIYKSHFPALDAKKMTPELEKAKNYEAEAEDLFMRSQIEIADAEKLDNNYSEQYIRKMGANDMLLYALELQEQAYLIYHNIGVPTTTVKESNIEKNKITQKSKPDVSDKEPVVSTWTVSKTYTYSKEKPKATIYKIKSGTVFLIQLGIFKGIVPPEKFGSVQPVIYDEFVANQNRRFMVGEYKSTEAVEAALVKVKKLGYDDAYIIALVNGKRKSYADAKAAVNSKENEYKQLKKSELDRVSGVKSSAKDVSTDETEKDENLPENSIKNTSGLVYLIQLGMYQKPISDETLKNLKPIYTDKIAEKGTRYMMGNFSSFAEAKQNVQKAKSKGFKDAYVIAYNEGEHVSLEEAKQIESQNGGTTVNKKVVTKESVTFMVQVGAYREKLNSSEESKLKADFSPRKITTRLADDMNVYAIGNYKNYKEADELKKKLLKEGHKGVFVIAFNGDDKIPVDEAIKLSDNK